MHFILCESGSSSFLSKALPFAALALSYSFAPVENNNDGLLGGGWITLFGKMCYKNMTERECPKVVMNNKQTKCGEI